MKKEEAGKTTAAVLTGLLAFGVACIDPTGLAGKAAVTTIAGLLGNQSATFFNDAFTPGFYKTLKEKPSPVLTRTLLTAIEQACDQVQSGYFSYKGLQLQNFQKERVRHFFQELQQAARSLQEEATQANQFLALAAQQSQAITGSDFTALFDPLQDDKLPLDEDFIRFFTANFPGAFNTAFQAFITKDDEARTSFHFLYLNKLSQSADFNQRRLEEIQSKLNDLFEKTATSSLIPQILGSLPSLEEEIIGREEDIEGLYQTLHAEQRVILMNGMGGIGKTTTAIAFANRYRDQYQHLLWIEQIEQFTSAIRSNVSLLKYLKITPSTDPVADTQMVLNQLSTLSGPSLLVIDNADQEVADFKDYLPKAPNWQILITSRQELSFAKIQELDFLPEATARELFYNHYQRDEDDATADAILRAIDYHTLTIELLAKTAQKRRITPLTRLSQLLEDRGLKIDRKVGFSIPHSKQVTIEKVFPYLKAIFQLDEAMSDEEIHMLKQFIGLPSTFIPYDLLLQLLQIDPTDEAATDRCSSTLDLLKEKGWLNTDEQGDMYKMHRIIQETLQAQLKPGFQELESLIEGVASLLDIDQAKDNPIDKFPMVPFGEHLAALFPDSQESLFAIFQSNLALVYQDLGRYKEAAALLESSLQSDRANYGEDHPSVASSQSNLALVYQDLGRYEEAAALLESSLQSDRANYGKEHPSVAIKQSNLALVYKDLGRYEEAVELLESSLQSDRANYGKEHPSVARRQSNLALVYKDLGRYEEAAALLESSLQSDLANYGEEHPSVAIRQSNLAVVYKNLGRYEEAAALLESSLQSDLANYGEEHPSVARSQSNLAIVYKYLGRYEEAMALLESSLKSDLNNFGNEHPVIATRRWNLVPIYLELGKRNQAYESARMAYTIFEKSLGLEHPHTQIVKQFLDKDKK